MARVVIDSSVLIGLLETTDHHHIEARRAFHRLEAEGAEFVISVIVLTEVLIGVFSSDPSGHTSEALLKVLSRFTTAPVDEGTAVRAARLRAATPRLKIPDALIVATAEEVGAEIILTADEELIRLVRLSGLHVRAVGLGPAPPHSKSSWETVVNVAGADTEAAFIQALFDGPGLSLIGDYEDERLATIAASGTSESAKATQLLALRRYAAGDYQATVDLLHPLFPDGTPGPLAAASACAMLGAAYIYTREHQAALPFLDFAATAGDPFSAVRAAVLHGNVGNWARVRELVDMAAASSQTARDARRLGIGLAINEGRPEEALEMANAELAELDESQGDEYAHVQLLRVAALLTLGRDAEAAATAALPEVSEYLARQTEGSPEGELAARLLRTLWPPTGGAPSPSPAKGPPTTPG